MTSRTDASIRAPIRAVVPVALREVVETLAPRFERETGRRIEAVHMLNPEVPAHVATGAGWDIAFTNPPYVARMVAAGHAETAGARPFARIPLALGARGEHTTERTEAGIAGVLRQARRIAYTGDGTSGGTFLALLARLGLADALADRLSALEGGGPMRAVLRGEADLAALPLTNVAPVPGMSATAVCPEDWDVHVDIDLCANEDGRVLADWLALPVVRRDLAGMGAESRL